MLSLATSRSKKPSAQPPDPKHSIGFRRDRRKAVFLFRVRHFREFLLVTPADPIRCPLFGSYRDQSRHQIPITAKLAS